MYDSVRASNMGSLITNGFQNGDIPGARAAKGDKAGWWLFNRGEFLKDGYRDKGLYPFDKKFIPICEGMDDERAASAAACWFT